MGSGRSRGWLRGALSLLACLLALAAGPALADGAPPKAPPKAPAKPHKVKLAFLGLRPLAGVDKGRAKAVSDYLLDTLNNRGVYQVLSPDDVKALLGLEAQKQLLGCNEDSSCLAQIAGSLGASRLLDGTLARIGSSILVSVTLLDTAHAEAVARVSRRVRSAKTLEPVLDVIPALVTKLVAADPSVAKEAEATPAGTGPGPASPAARAPSHPGRPPRLTIGIEGRGGGAAWQGAGLSGAGPMQGGSIFLVYRFSWFDLGASLGSDSDLFGGTATNPSGRLDLRIHLWDLHTVRLYIGAGLRFAPTGFRAFVGGEWPIHAFGREAFLVVSNLCFEAYGGGLSGFLTLGFGYSFP